MTVRDFEILIQEYEKQALKTGKQRPLTESEKVVIFQNTNQIPIEYLDAFKKAEMGNFSQFDSLPLLLKTYLGAIRVGQLREKFKNDLSLNNEELKSYLKERAMDVSLRAGISVEKNSGDEAKRDTARAFDTFMNTYVMQSTMMPPTEEEKQALRKSIGVEAADLALAKDLKRQCVLAKTYFLAQLGKYDILGDNGLGKSFDLPLSETLVHGSRTNFVLPSGTDTKQVIDAYMGTHANEEPVIEERTAATHHVKRRAISKNGLIKSETKESRTYSPLKVFGHQYGMDLSVGGIGKKGPNGKVISGNGESGHAYMRIEEGDEKHCASLLLGIEGSAPGKDSALGHSHGASGVSANQSAFFTDKQIIGAKNGGRQVDLSGIKSEELSELLNTFSQKYTELQNNANTPEGLEKLAEVNGMLMGKHMNIKELIGFFDELDMTGEKTNALLSQARKGYLNGVKANEVTKDRFEQSIRKGFSQEKACKIAEARFVHSTDLAHSVGAIKELMLTHETRSLRWKLRHPIKNYRENAKISDLTKRLKNEKGYNSIQIANEFVRESNSFEMDWGESLSNDRDVIQFERENKQQFLYAESMLPRVLKENYRDQIKEATPQNESSLKMKAELQKVFAERANKEQIVITEESERNKTTQKTSEPIIAQQPSKGKKKGL